MFPPGYQPFDKNFTALLDYSESQIPNISASLRPNFNPKPKKNCGVSEMFLINQSRYSSGDSLLFFEIILYLKKIVFSIINRVNI